jgi:hypothetical protein
MFKGFIYKECRPNEGFQKTQDPHPESCCLGDKPNSSPYKSQAINSASAMLTSVAIFFHGITFYVYKSFIHGENYRIELIFSFIPVG